MGFSGKNTGVGCHSLLQRIFPSQGSKPLLCPVHCRWFFVPLSHLGSLHLVVLMFLIRFSRWFTKLPFILIHFIIFLKRVSWENIPWFLKKSVSVQFSSVAQSCPTLCDPMNRSTPGLHVHYQLPEFIQLMSIESVMPSSHLIVCCPLLLLVPIPPSSRVFSNESALLIRLPKYWSFSFNISSSKEQSGLISFRMDWLDLLAVQGTLKSLLPYHSSKTSILQCSAFFTVQLSHPYMTTGKTIALTRWTFVGKVMSLLFNMLLGW